MNNKLVAPKGFPYDRIMAPKVGGQRRKALVVVAKPALVGQVKTRLCPPLTLSQAAALYECMMDDMVTKMEECQTADLWVAFSPKGEEYFRRTFGGRARLLPQRGNDLGERLHHVFVDFSNLGYREIVVTGGDSPTVPLSSIEQAYDLLDKNGCDLVLGPCRDGGYYLVGLKGPVEGLFRQIPWSSAAVMEKTVERASELGLKLVQLPLAYDIDVGDDLKSLWKDFESSPGLREGAQRTYAYLARLFRDSRLAGKA